MYILYKFLHIFNEDKYVYIYKEMYVLYTLSFKLLYSFTHTRGRVYRHIYAHSLSCAFYDYMLSVNLYFFFFNAMSLQSLGNHDSPQISFLYYLWIAMHLLRACNAWSTPKPQTYKIYHLQATIWNKDKTRFNQI